MTDQNTSVDLKEMLYSNTGRIIQSAQNSKVKAKGLITNDTQYRFQYAKVLKLFEKADKLAAQRKTDKLKKVEKEIIALSSKRTKGFFNLFL
jgi:hypothetical protein